VDNVFPYVFDPMKRSLRPLGCNFERDDVTVDAILEKAFVQILRISLNNVCQTLRSRRIRANVPLEGFHYCDIHGGTVESALSIFYRGKLEENLFVNSTLNKLQDCLNAKVQHWAVLEDVIIVGIVSRGLQLHAVHCEMFQGSSPSIQFYDPLTGRIGFLNDAAGESRLHIINKTGTCTFHIEIPPRRKTIRGLSSCHRYLKLLGNLTYERVRLAILRIDRSERFALRKLISEVV